MSSFYFIRVAPWDSIVNSALLFEEVWGDFKQRSIRRLFTLSPAVSDEPLVTKRLVFMDWLQDKPKAGSRFDLSLTEVLDVILLVASLVTRKGTLYSNERALQLLEIWKNLDDRSCHGFFSVSFSCLYPLNNVAIPSKMTTDIVGWSFNKRGRLFLNKSIRSSWFRTQFRCMRDKYSSFMDCALFWLLMFSLDINDFRFWSISSSLFDVLIRVLDPIDMYTAFLFFQAQSARVLRHIWVFPEPAGPARDVKPRWRGKEECSTKNSFSWECSSWSKVKADFGLWSKIALIIESWGDLSDSPSTRSLAMAGNQKLETNSSPNPPKRANFQSLSSSVMISHIATFSFVVTDDAVHFRANSKKKSFSMYVIFYENLRRVRRISFAGRGLGTMLRVIHLSFGFDVQQVRKLCAQNSRLSPLSELCHSFATQSLSVESVSLQGRNKVNDNVCSKAQR